MNAHILSGRYKVVQSLASGGMGQTFIAEDTQLPGHPICVVKQLKLAVDDSAFLATAKRLFVSEAETLQKLGTHDQIPRLLAYFEESKEFYLVQDYIEGHSLSQELPLGQRWSEPQVIQLLKDILEVLAFVHQQNVIHRDIKPDNIIRRAHDQKLVLIDFGAVKQIQSQQTVVGSRQVSGTVAIGTQGYMPSEQLSGKPRMSSDLYAVGKIAIQALTGLLPTQLFEDEEGELIWRDQTSVSDEFAEFLTKMVRDYHKLRYQSSEEALEALQQLSTDTAPSARGSAHSATVINTEGYTPTTAKQALSNPIPSNPFPLQNHTQSNTPAQPSTATPEPFTGHSVAAGSAASGALPAATGNQSSNQSSGEFVAPADTSNHRSSATVVVSPSHSGTYSDAGYSHTGGTSVGPSASPNKNKRTRAWLITGALALCAVVGGAIAYQYSTPGGTAVSGSGGDNQGTGGQTTVPVELAGNQFRLADFPQSICGDSNIVRPFYRVYVLDTSLQATVAQNYCQDAYIESQNNRVKVASFDTPEPAEQFQEFMEYYVGPTEIIVVE